MIKNQIGFYELLKSPKLIILDGAMGTELQRRGYNTTLPLWSAKANTEAPELVKQIHLDFIAAGADVITTNTFRTTKRTFEKASIPEMAVESSKKAVAIAKAAAKESKRKVFIAGSVTTLEDCYEPKLVPDEKTLEKEHSFQIEMLVSLGVDFILAETINSVKEANVIAGYLEKINFPFCISFVSDGKGNLLSGESIKVAVETIKKYKPLAVLLNCRSLEISHKDFHFLKNCYDGPTGIYANGCGKPEDNLGWSFEGCINPLEQYVRFAEKWIEEGVKIIGGCCGTTPEYIKCVAQAAPK